MRRTKTGPARKHTTQWGFEIAFQATGFPCQIYNNWAFAQHAINRKREAELVPFAAMLVTPFAQSAAMQN
jgi:hypothetical protein